MRRNLTLIVFVALIGAGCAGGGPGVTDPPTVDSTAPVVSETITFWFTETRPERVQVIREITDAFTAETGIGVKLTSIEENALPAIMNTHGAAGTLPEVVLHPIDFTIGFAAAGLLDTVAAREAVDELGADTFNQGALRLVGYQGTPAAVPSDGWGQLLVYRKDLFAAAGLEAPTTFAAIEAAAAALTDAGNDFYGITASTDPTLALSQQIFEHFALANGCELINATGAVTVDSSNCVEALAFYTDLLAAFAAPAVEGLVESRARYFAGKAAMIVSSPFILDEMAGLRDTVTPACLECQNDVAFLARNSGIVTALRGPSGGPAQFAQLSSLGIGAGSNTTAARQFIEFWLSDGYLDWLGTSAEGKFPMRTGTADSPTLYADRWRTLETGVDRRARLDDFYPDELLIGLVEGLGRLDRWGFPQGQSALVGALYESLPIGRVVRAVLDTTMTAAEGAVQMRRLVEEEQALLE